MVLEFVDHDIDFVDGGDDLFVRFVVRQQGADRALAILDIVHKAFEFADGRIQAIVESGIVNQFADGTLATFDEGDDAVETLQQGVHVLQGALAGTNYILDIRMVASGENVAPRGWRSLGIDAADIDIGLTEHAGSGQAGYRVLAKVERVLGVDFHYYFYRSITVAGHQPDALNVADVHAFQSHGRADAQAARIVEVRNQFDFLGEDSARAAHEEDQNAERDAGEDDGESDAKLRPLQLLLARHVRW